MVVDITLYRDRCKVRFVYNNGDVLQWIEYPEGTKVEAMKLIKKWYDRYKDVLDACGISVAVHDNDYFSYDVPHR